MACLKMRICINRCEHSTNTRAILGDPYSFFLKVVRRASMSDNMLALAKFYLPIQKCRIIKKQMVV